MILFKLTQIMSPLSYKLIMSVSILLLWQGQIYQFNYKMNLFFQVKKQNSYVEN